jgi:hypothetical protein
MFTSNGCEPHFDNAALEQCIFRFQKGDAHALTQIVALSEQRARVLVRHYGTHHYKSESELLSDINYKLLRSVGRFDPSKGSAFTFISAVITSTLRTSVTSMRRHWARHCELGDELANTLQAGVDDRTSADDLVHRIRSRCRTRLSEPRELETQRWYVTSFCDEGFAYRRHQCADAAIAVYQLSHGRSRELYDLTMLEVRRALFNDLKPRGRIVPGRLLGTRAAWMARYSPLLSGDEFTRFYFLMKDLAPYLLLLITDPAKANNHRRDRNPAIGRQTLKLILYGHPDAQPLFE